MQNRQTGLTIVEMMIALAVIGIVMTLVVPSAQTIVNQNRIVAEINEVSSVIQFARATAIDEQVDVIVCPTADFTDCSADWDNPKMVFADEDNNGSRGADEEILVATSHLSNANDLTGPAVAVRFLASGVVNDVATLLICHHSNEARYARELYINAQGRVKISRDSNDDGVHESYGGSDLTCS